MKTLTVILKQHTPLIHFQHDQYGATLRASEVKPKLDRFVLAKLGNDIYADGTKKAKANGWLIGKGEYPALDYKLKIVSKERISNLHLRNIEKEEEKWTTEDFPLLLANMGGRNAVDELVNFSMHRNVVMYVTCRNDDLYDELMKQFPYFIVNTNFGQRSNKGFGSFTIEYIEEFNGVKKKIDSRGYKPCYIAEDTLYMDFCLEKDVYDDEAIYSLKRQKVIFKVIENYWSRLRNSVNKDTSVDCAKIDSVETYIKGMKFIEQDDENVQRLPAPIMFKPISYIDEENLNVAVYVMLDSIFIERLQHQYGHELKITKTNVLLADKINDLSYVDSFSENMLNLRYNNLRMHIENEVIDIEFCGQ